MFTMPLFFNFPVDLISPRARQPSISAVLTASICRVSRVTEIISGAATVTSTVGTVAQPIGILGQQMVNDYKAMGQTVVQAGQALGQQMLSSLGNTGAQLGAFTDQIGTLTEAYESQFCTPAVFIPAVKTPATLYGPAFDIILDSGSCELNEEALLRKLTPLVSYQTVPGHFLSPTSYVNLLSTASAN
jgi:hypothetical protein